MTEVEVSSAGRVVYPEIGLTKGDVVDYYRDIAGRMGPHVDGRPLTLHRFPRGTAHQGFMQKNAPDHYPESIQRLEVPKQDEGTTVYPVVVDSTDLAWLANQGAIAFHVWTSRLPDLTRPDRIIFDLDPAEDDLDGVVRAAIVVRDELAELGIPTTPMATGSKGYHLVTPIRPEIDGSEVAGAAHGLAELLAARHPELLTTEFRKKKRTGRVFVDWLRNRTGQTGVAAWSLRATPTATVAVPFAWDDLAETPPDRFTLESIADAPGDDPILEAAREPVDAATLVEDVTRTVSAAGIELTEFDRFRS